MRRRMRAYVVAPVAALALLAVTAPVNAQQPAQQQAQEPAQQPAQEQAQQPAQQQAQEPAQQPAQEQAQQPEIRLAAVGLTEDGRLVTFTVNDTSNITEIGAITGLVGDTKLVGIDFRPQDGKLYGVGDVGGIYTLHDKGQVAKVSELTVKLEGNAFGVDFDPSTDRLRIVSNAGQNLHHDVSVNGLTVVDKPLFYPHAAGTPVDGVTAVAYTNNDTDAETGTTLFAIDTTSNQLAIQSPPDEGLLAATSPLGVAAGPAAGFDIYTELKDGKGVGNLGIAVLKVGDAYRLYRINHLPAGGTTELGAFPAENTVVDIAIGLDG